MLTRSANLYYLYDGNKISILIREQYQNYLRNFIQVLFLWILKFWPLTLLAKKHQQLNLELFLNPYFN